MKTNGSSKFDLIVIEKSRVGKGMSICYVSPVAGVDFDEAVYDFFEDAGIAVTPETVERIAKNVFHKGFSLWKDYHFEMLIK
jgi:selenophosphate synthetase-related protein